MPYRYGGRRSAGCQACRARKVKCDETRPICGRCRRAGKACEFRNTFDLVLHDETSHASQRAESLWQKRSTKQGASDEAASTRTSSRSVTKSPAPSSSDDYSEDLSLGMVTLPLYELCMQRFFFDYVFQQNWPRGRSGYLEYLPTVYKSLNDQSFVLSAFKAAAFANFATRCSSESASSAAFNEYGKAIQSTNLALRDPEMVVKDETLLACQLLGICELNMSKETAFVGWHMHSQGAAALLEYRGSAVLDTPLGTSLFKAVFAQELYKCLRFCQRPRYVPPFLSQIFDPISTNLHLLVGRVSSLCADYLDWKKNAQLFPEDLHSTALDLFREARNLDVQIETLVSTMEAVLGLEKEPKATYRPLPFWITNLINSDPRAPEFVHVYSGFGPCFIWNTLRYARIRLQQLVTLLSESGFNPDVAGGTEVAGLAAATMLMLSEEISSTVPALLLASSEKPIEPGYDKGQQIPSFRSFLLMRCIFAAQMTLRFLERRGLILKDRLLWLQDICSCVKEQTTLIVPPQMDPLEGDWDDRDHLPEYHALLTHLGFSS